MKFIGITGGVGAGKSELLHFMEREYPVRVLLADEVAHELMEPGTECYKEIVNAFGNEDIFQPDGTFDRIKLAKVIFSDIEKREKMNAIVHPAVKAEVLRQVELERQKGEIQAFILEAALLIEDNYHKVCDELWYIYTREDVRRSRLKASRGYSDEKIDAIFKSQLSEVVYRQYCKQVIDNNGTTDEAFAQIRVMFNQL